MFKDGDASTEEHHQGEPRMADDGWQGRAGSDPDPEHDPGERLDPAAPACWAAPGPGPILQQQFERGDPGAQNMLLAGS